MLAGLAAGLVVLNFFEAFAAMSFFWAGLILLYALAHKLEVSRPVTAPAP
jgi:predicted lipid-binding transport protein (Tim44 family)